MAKVVKGTKDLHLKKARDFRVLKGPADARQVRCPGCKELAAQVPDGQGGTIYQCSCGRRFKFQKI